MTDRALITGGAGFIGNHVARELIKRGWEVVCYDDLSVGKEDYLPDEAEFIKGDIRKEEPLTEAMSGCTHVFHLAARVSIRKAVDTFIDDASVNTLGTLRALSAARNAGVKRFIYSSSMAVYGDSEYSPQDEKHPINPTSPYGVGKYASEKYIQSLFAQWGIEPVILRYFNTYGPRQTPSPYVGVITIFCGKLMSGDEPVIFGDGEQVRDFIHVEDVARGTVDAGMKAPAGSIINIGTGVGTSVNRISELLIKRLAPEISCIHSDPIPGEPGDSIADIQVAKKLLGWSPQRKIEEGINDAIEWNRIRYNQ
ncbi:MAG TPA: NAD-dependent epimerase/dehydratase family protein [bacterium]|jgi:UDP-glucose 4-epimerase